MMIRDIGAFAAGMALVEQQEQERQDNENEQSYDENVEQFQYYGVVNGLLI